jgi:uncharacterized protein (TIGR03086 family)
MLVVDSCDNPTEQGALVMSEISERYRKVASQFMQRAKAVPDGAWDKPSPCEGWLARDIVRHIVEWMPAFFLSYAAIEFPKTPSVDADPVGAWEVVSDAIQAALDDPDVAAREFDMPMGRLTLEQAVAMICIGDVLVHTWDLARATGLDEALDAGEVHRLVEAMEQMDEPMRQSGHYGARIEVPGDVDEQTRLIAFTGRRP